MDHSEIDADHLDQFFKKANVIVDVVTMIVKDLYQSVLKREDPRVEIEEVYFMKISTIADDLIKIESPLQSKIFKFSDYFESAIEYNSIKWILEKAHNRAIIDLEDYRNVINEGNFEWFTMNTSGDRSSTGLYYKHHLSDHSGTEFYGVMHDPKDSSQRLDILCKNFSGAVIRMTSPFI
jgi:hypothetical protein